MVSRAFQTITQLVTDEPKLQSLQRLDAFLSATQLFAQR